MALGTIPRAVEILLPGFRISGLKVRQIDGTASTTDRFSLGFLIVNECDDRAQVRIVEIKRRHSFVGASRPHQRADLVSARIFGNECRAREVWTGFATGRIATVAESALRSKTSLPGHDEFRRIRLWIHRLRRLPRC